MNVTTKLVRAALALADAQREFEIVSSGARNSADGATAITDAVKDCHTLEALADSYREFFISARTRELPRVYRALGSLARAARIDSSRYAAARAILENID